MFVSVDAVKKRHPMGNFTCDTLIYCKWQSRRKGNLAYDTDGNILDRDLFPVFIKRVEIENRISKLIAEEKLSTVSIFRKMLLNGCALSIDGWRYNDYR